jgi:zinc transport system permease protein
MFDFLMWPFMIRAILIGLTLALSTGIISSFLVSNNQSLIGDGLAHISFTGIIIGVLFASQPIWIALPFVILAALIIKWLMRNQFVEGDTAIGLVSSFSFAIGLIIISTSSGFNRSVESMLVGSIFSTTWSDIWISLTVLILTSAFIITGYAKLFSITFDANYAKFSRIKIAYYDYMLAVLTAVIIVIGVKTIGTLLISAFIIFPAVSSQMISKSFKQMVIQGLLINAVVSLIGILIAHFLGIPAGSTIIVVHGLLFMSLFVFTKLKGRD